jgi:hypothetical protein
MQMDLASLLYSTYEMAINDIKTLLPGRVQVTWDYTSSSAFGSATDEDYTSSFAVGSATDEDVSASLTSLFNF